MKDNPEASAAEVVKALAEKGVKVTAGLVFMNKGRLKQAKVHRKRKMKRAARVALVAANGRRQIPWPSSARSGPRSRGGWVRQPQGIDRCTC